METIIGFAAGYLAGSAEGSAGPDRLRSSLRAIANSQEARRLAAEGVALASAVLREAANRGVGGFLLARKGASASRSA
jgi:hypothetical protein